MAIKRWSHESVHTNFLLFVSILLNTSWVTTFTVVFFFVAFRKEKKMQFTSSKDVTAFRNFLDWAAFVSLGLSNFVFAKLLKLIIFICIFFFTESIDSLDSSVDDKPRRPDQLAFNLADKKPNSPFSPNLATQSSGLVSLIYNYYSFIYLP